MIFPFILLLLLLIVSYLLSLKMKLDLNYIVYCDGALRGLLKYYRKKGIDVSSFPLHSSLTERKL